MKKYITYILLLFVGFMCFTTNVFATFTVERTGGTGKTAIYSVKSSIKYSKDSVSVTPGEGVKSATIKWNDDGLSGTLTVTFSSADCKGDVTINYKATEGCEEVKPKNCDAILQDARSMIGRIPYEFAAKCASTSFEECQFNRIWTDKYPAIKGVTTSTPGNYPNNKTRHGDGKGHTGLDCSGFVWWIYNRHGIDLIGKGGGMASAQIASVNNITSYGKVYAITKEKAQPCDLVTGVKPDNGSIPHIGIVSQVTGGMMFIHENSSDDNVVENCYFDCEAAAQGKAVKYWRVAALWDGKEGGETTCDGKEKISLDNSEFCTCDTCDEIEIDPEHIEPLGSYYNNCCKDGNSHLKEYRVSQLFCSEENKKLNIQYYDDQCNNELYKDDKFDTLLSKNTYCKVYCTEEIDIKVPKEIETASGKFFKLAELEYNDLNGKLQKTKAPVVSGSKTCTIKVDYAQWRAEYIKTLKMEVEQFNISQEKYAYYEILKNPTITTETLTNNVSFNCTANNATVKKIKVGQNGTYLQSNGTIATCTSSECEVDSYVGTNSSYMDSSGNPATCTSVACLEYEKKTSNPSTSCQNTYKLYKVNTSGKDGVTCSGGKCSANYYQVKLDGPVNPDTSTKFDGVKIVSDGTRTATYDEKTGWPENDGCSSALESFKNSQTGYTCEQVGGAADLPDGLKKEKMDEKAEKYYKKEGDNAAGQLSNKTVDATTLEKAMDTCQNMFDKETYAKEPKEKDETFDEADGRYKESNYYNLNPTVAFKYMQVYLDGTEKKGEWQTINFAENKCEYKFSNTEVDDIDDKEKVIYYSGKYGDGEEDMRDMKPLPPSDGRVSNTSELNTLLDDANKSGTKTSKKFRRDAEYKALCTWTGEDIPKRITLYPGPLATNYEESYGETMVSEHKYQYALYLTTYQADYETYWELGNLGGSNRTIEKFMTHFNGPEARTCAESNELTNEEKKAGREAIAFSDGSSDSPEEITKSGSSSTTAFTCVMKAQYGGMRIGSCQYGVQDIENCHDNEIKEVFEFKIVDPKDMFPGDWSNKAHNWKKSDGTWGPTYGTIDTTAETDETYSPKNLTYAYKLDTATIKAIKSYNKDHPYSSYKEDQDTFSCTCPSDLYGEEERVDQYDCGTINKPVNDKCLTEIKGKKRWKYTCRECKSSFLETLTLEEKVKTGDATYTKVGTTWNNKDVSFNDVRKNNNWA